MKEKTKEFFKKNLIGFIFGVVCAEAVIVYAQTYFPSNDVTYDNTESGLASTNVQGAIDELYGVCFPSTPANEVIIEDAGLEKDPYECRYFFTGANPNNYITFNGETAGWRIISVECDGTIKIMRTESIGNMAWDSYSNNWARPASLNTYLNGTYYNGLNSTAKSQIVAKDFSIGATDSMPPETLSSQINSENSLKWNGKIGLISLTEYLRVNSNEQCHDSMFNNNSTCITTNWIYDEDKLFKNGTFKMWFVTASGYIMTSNAAAITLNKGGEIGNAFVYKDDNSVVPSLYLSADIKITGGDGRQSNPYQISL